jgi:Predicted thioesterase
MISSSSSSSTSSNSYEHLALHSSSRQRGEHKSGRGQESRGDGNNRNYHIHEQERHHAGSRTTGKDVADPWCCSSSSCYTSPPSHVNLSPEKKQHKENYGTELFFMYCSEPMQVYIEDTDAYGVVYNAKYISFYERALYEIRREYRNKERRNQQSSNRGERNDGISIGSSSFIGQSQSSMKQNKRIPSSIVLDTDEDFCLTALSDHHFKSSLSLGSQFIILAKLVLDDRNVACHDNYHEEIWSLQMQEYTTVQDTSRTCDSSPSTILSKVVNSATVTVSKGKHAAFRPSLQVVSPRTTNLPIQPLRSFQNTFIVHPDEFHIHLPNALPIRTVLNLFIRQNSIGIGGPVVLSELQEKYNFQYVVSSINHVNIYHAPAGGEDGDGRRCSDHSSAFDEEEKDQTFYIKPGMMVTVRSCVRVKRKGMILEFELQITAKKQGQCVVVSPDGIPPKDHPQEYLLADGVVTYCAFDCAKRRPTSKVPKGVLEKFLPVGADIL